MEKIVPMLLRLRDSVIEDEGYLFEVKLDGIRLIADSRGVFLGEGAEFLLYSRQGNSYDKELKGIKKELNERFFGRGIVFDGELIMLDEDAKPDFYGLLGSLKSGGQRLYYVIFDVLYVDGISIEVFPLLKRKAVLNELFAESENAKVKVKGEASAHHHVKKADYFLDGKALFKATEAAGLEGIVAKRMDSIYGQGRRDLGWYKIKVRRSVDAYIVGLIKNKRAVALAVDLGDNKLLYVGNAGSGLSDSVFSKLKDELFCYALPNKKALKNIDWNGCKDEILVIEPIKKVKVSFLEIGKSGRLRNPSITAVL